MSFPRKICLPKIGSPNLGYISVAQNNLELPFEIKRVYWTYFTPHDVLRGGHAHKSLEQVIFSVNGKINFNVEDFFGEKYDFELSEPNEGIYLPPLTWREIKFSHSAVLLCLASEVYLEEDYIRNYDEFKNMKL